MAPSAASPDRLTPTWEPAALEAWCEPGGPLHNTGTLADLCGSNPADPAAQHQLATTTQRVAELEALGVRPGEVVAWQLPNCGDSVVMYRACWELGAVAAPIHHLAGDAEVESMLAALSPTAFMAPDGQLAQRKPSTEAADTGTSSSRTSSKRTSATRTSATRTSSERTSSAQRPSVTATPSDIAVVLHTSGSSGRPKGVMHTHRALAYKARTMARLHGLGASDAVLMPAPLAHVSGLLNGILVPAAAGMRTVLMARWDPEDALALIESERVTFMVGPPTFFIGLEQADGFHPERVESLRVLSVGGAGVTPEFVDRTSQIFGAQVKRSYGSTEAPTVTSSATTDDPWTMARTDGRPTGAVQIRTVAPE
ncbi:MAG: class I adenylate-forming enzyme family protein, partial [Microthrixaceae bacterium]